MPIIPFGEYRPDVSDYRGQTSQTIKNVLPRGDGYGPFKSLSPSTASLPGACRGIGFARKADGTISVFAGTSTRLYKLDNTDLTWSDVSNGGSAYSALSSDAQWQFAQFNSKFIAVQKNVAPQVFDIGSDTAFSDLAGSPPNASYVSVVNRFVVLSGIASPNVYRVQWSDLNGITTWSSGQADSQDLADGGIVRGVAGGEFGVIFQDTTIRRMTYAPGSPYVFGIDRISADDGLFAAYSLVQAGDRIFFLSPQGFKMLLPGGYPQPIGKEKVDRAFFADADLDNPQLIIGAHNPRSQRVHWAYKSQSAATGTFDRILSYDFALDRWTYSEQSGQYIASLARPGLTLENVDGAYGSDIDTLDLSSFDDISALALQGIGGVDTSSAMGFFTGSNLEATMITAEQGDDAQRLRIRGLRPVTDATDAMCSVIYRETAQSDSTTSTESSINVIGICDQNVTGRYARGKLRIPSGSAWTFASGIEPDIVSVGKR